MASLHSLTLHYWLFLFPAPVWSFFFWGTCLGITVLGEPYSIFWPNEWLDIFWRQGKMVKNRVGRKFGVGRRSRRGACLSKAQPFPAKQMGTASTNPDRPLPDSKKAGFYREKSKIALLNLYNRKPDLKKVRELNSYERYGSSNIRLCNRDESSCSTSRDIGASGY